MNRKNTLLDRLQPFRDAGVLDDLDVQFALAMCRVAREADADVALGAALASRAPRLGHIYADCADTDTVRVEPGVGGELPELEWPEGDSWVAALRGSKLVRTPGAEALGAGNRRQGEATTPLVLAGSHLYLDRYWRYQLELGTALAERASDHRDVDGAALREILWNVFPEVEGIPEPNLQRLAVAVAALRGLTVITGGPGTGKTTTVLRLLALLVELTKSRAAPPRIALAAPTGKAAARMAESIRDGKAALGKTGLAPGVIDAIPDTASTLHRLLGYQRRSPTRFRHNRSNPLPVDILVIDEASMISLALMAKAVDAVPSHARLVLLGDRDQLTSIEAGAVLADLCAPGGKGSVAGFSGEHGAQLTGLVDQLPPDLVAPPDSEPSGKLADSIVHLRHSHRFDPSGGIGRLAADINNGRADAALALLRGAADAPEEQQIALIESDEPRRLQRDLRRLVVERYAAVSAATTPLAALASLREFSVLCAHRRGPLGALSLNDEIQGWLAAAGKLKVDGSWYVGRRVMVVQNDYQLGLFNGDIGVVINDESDRSRLVVAFPTTENDAGFRTISPGRLPPHETVFAMTVHKSQGSEFERVVVVLPPKRSPILTRELLYTGVTRARSHVTIVGTSDVISRGIAQSVRRASGLQDMLW